MPGRPGPEDSLLDGPASEDARLGPDGSRSAWADRLTRSGPWGVLAEKWVPEPLRGARVDPGRRGAIFLSALAALAAAVAAVGVWWSRPQPVPLLSAGISAAVPDPGAAPGPPPAVSRAGTGPDTASDVVPDGGGPVLVSVTGHVRSPGLVTVPADARVADAITAAGGALDEADLTGINLAARLVDGMSIVVAGTASTVDPGNGSTAGGTPGPALININSADSTALQQLAGVGPVTAGAIITYRTDHGPFTDLEQLQEVPGIGPATFARIAPHVTL